MTDAATKRQREAAAAKRYRARHDAGQMVLGTTAMPDRAERLIGYLRPGQPEPTNQRGWL